MTRKGPLSMQFADKEMTSCRGHCQSFCLMRLENGGSDVSGRVNRASVFGIRNSVVVKSQKMSGSLIFML